MGLFEKAGRHVERFKQRASEAAREAADHECADCGEPLYADAETCPECGAAAVVERASNDTGETPGDAAGSESGGEATEAEPGDESGGDGAGDDAV